MSYTALSVTPYLQDPDCALYHGDAIGVLRELPDESVHCIATSPPFFALRDYGTGRWEGGDAECDHGSVRREHDPADKQATNQGSSRDPVGRNCRKCGARRIDQQIGLEETPDAWAAALVAVFREARRVLRKDGTLWVECGDSYAQGHGGSSTESAVTMRKAARGPGAVSNNDDYVRRKGIRNIVPGLKPKDLLGTPWLLAFALRADGWWLRGCNIWAKPNAMPESAKDRCTTAHSYVFQLSRSARYFFDGDAISEPAEMKPQQRFTARADHPKGDEGRPVHRRPEGGGGIIAAPQIETLDVTPAITATSDKNGASGVGNEPARESPSFTDRNPRSVWNIPTQGYPEAHFATWPEALARRIISAATSERGVCSECGAPWVRETSSTYERIAGRSPKDSSTHKNRHGQEDIGGYRPKTNLTRVAETLGWLPSCECKSIFGQDVNGKPRYPWPPVPATILDPFVGSGTTCFVARKLGRRSIGIDLSAEYLDLAARRLAQQSLLAVEA